MFEAVSRPASGDPNVLEVGMAIDEEVAIRGVLVLADVRVNNGRIAQSGESGGDVSVRGRYFVGGHDAVGGIGIERGPVQIESNFEASSFEIGEAVHSAIVFEIDPNRHLWGFEARVTGGDAEEENFLTRRENAVGKQVWKHFS